MDIGFKVANRYLVDSVVHRSRKFCVYRATDQVLDTSVELKTIQPRLLKVGPSWVDVLRSEAVFARRLCHANIRPTYHFEFSEELPFVVMEPFDGVTLSEFLRQKGGPLEDDEFVRLGCQAASAIEHVHKRGLLLGEISLDEVRISSAGKLRFTDLSALKENGEKPRRAATSPQASVELLRIAARIRNGDSPAVSTPRRAVWGTCIVQEEIWSQGDLAIAYTIRPRTIATDLHSLGRVFYAMLAGPGRIPDAEDLEPSHAASLPKPAGCRDWRPLVASCLDGFGSSRSQTAANIRRQFETTSSVRA